MNYKLTVEYSTPSGCAKRSFYYATRVGLSVTKAYLMERNLPHFALVLTEEEIEEFTGEDIWAQILKDRNEEYRGSYA